MNNDEHASDPHGDFYETPSGSPNFKTELAAQLSDLVPEAIADGKVDVEKLKELLDDDVADSSERFGLFWPGKKRALRAAQEPTTATLKPDFENSKDWDTTKNVFIEGDNLEVLKILQRHYHGKVDVIYIDPPYNTGGDFLYPDNFTEGLAAYLDFTKQVDEGGKALSTNSETEGRFHSNWLNMMYPRLKLARNLLAPDGIMFISIGDHEQANLKLLCDQVFGEDNFVAIAPRKTGAGSAATRSEAALRKLNDFVYIYTRSKASVLKRKLMGQKQYPFEDASGRYLLGQFQASGSDATRTARPNMWFPIYVTTDGSITSVEPAIYDRVILPNEVNGEEGRWLWSKEKFENDKDTLLHFDGTSISRKVYFDPEQDQSVYQVEKAWFEDFRNADGTKEVDELFKRKKVFDHPKPTALLKHLINLHPNPNAVVLDFFAGSSSTADAVMQLNAEDGGARSFILVQLPEPTPDGKVARKAGFANIAQVSRKRIDLAGAKIQASRTEGLFSEGDLDTGYRAFVLSDTNFSKWRLTSDADATALEQHLLDLRESADDDATPDALLTELLLKQGYSLTEQISAAEIDGLKLNSVGDGLVLAYLDEQHKPTLQQLRAVLGSKDLAKFIILEDAFNGDDELKTNLVQEAKTRGVELWTA